MMNNRSAVFIVTISSLVLSFLHCPLFEIFFDDKEIFKYAGLVIAKGGVPYRDFFDHKPPLIFFLNYAGLLFNGWGLWLIDAALVLITSIIFFRLCKKYQSILPWLPPLLFNLLIRDQFVSFGIGMTREYTAIFVLLFFCAMLSDSKWKYYLQGIYTALVFFMQQDQILVVLPFIVYALLQQASTNKRWITWLEFAASFIVVAVLIVGYFVYHQSLRYFWEDAFAFNFNWYNKSHSFFDNFKNIRNRLNSTSYEIPFSVTFILGVSSIIFGNKYKQILIYSLASLLLSFCAAFISGKFVDGIGIIYYFLPLSATIPIVLFLVFCGDHKLSIALNKKIVFIFATILLLQPALGAMQYAMHLPKLRWNITSTSDEFRYLKNKQLKDYDLYIAFNANQVYLYNELRILSPSKWIYHFFWDWFSNWDKDTQVMQSITQDLINHKTRYVLDYSRYNFQFKNKNVQEYWMSFMESHYEVDPGFQLNSGVVLWKLKSIKD